MAHVVVRSDEITNRSWANAVAGSRSEAGRSVPRFRGTAVTDVTFRAFAAASRRDARVPDAVIAGEEWYAAAQSTSFNDPSREAEKKVKISHECHG